MSQPCYVVSDIITQVTDGILGEGSATTNVPDGLVSHYIDSPGFGDFVNGKSIIMLLSYYYLFIFI